MPEFEIVITLLQISLKNLNFRVDAKYSQCLLKVNLDRTDFQSRRKLYPLKFKLRSSF